MLLMIDNYDSFTYNLVQYLGELGAEVRVVRNDQLTVAAVEALRPQRIVISPGPGTPADAGISMDVVRTLAQRIPILGVCLGHQAIAAAFGGRIVHARQVMHGKPSAVHHDGSGVFRALPSPFQVIRYHSLVVEPASLPDCLVATAWTRDVQGERDELMGLRHCSLPLEGVQFHPESIFSEYGHALLRSFLEGEAPAPCAAAG